MVDLFCTPFVDLIQRMRLEFRNQQAIFDLPARKWWLPAADGSTWNSPMWKLSGNALRLRPGGILQERSAVAQRSPGLAARWKALNRW